MQEAAGALGGLDVIVLNHILVVPLGDWLGNAANLTLMQRLFDVKFRAYVHIASHAMPHLERSQGSIVIVSSVSGSNSPALPLCLSDNPTTTQNYTTHTTHFGVELRDQHRQHKTVVNTMFYVLKRDTSKFSDRFKNAVSLSHDLFCIRTALC